MIIESSHSIGEKIGIKFIPDNKYDGVRIDITEFDDETNKIKVIHSGYLLREQFRGLIKSMVEVDNNFNIK